MAGPKVAVIGAGSYFFGKPVIHKMATSKIMKGGILALTDTDESVLKTMMGVAKNVFDDTGCDVKVAGSIDRREVMADADFIVLTFSYRNAYYRGVDTKIAAKHGIRMCSSDTIGPGGIFRAMREVPHVISMAKDTKDLAPHAWLINFVNPTTVLGMALRRYAPDVKSFALCDGHHEPYVTLRWCKYVGILPQDAMVVPPDVANKLDLAIGGVNHAMFMVRFRYNGQDMMPEVRKQLVREVEEEKQNPNEKAKPRYNKAYMLQLFDIYGALPPSVSHTKEYVPFFQGYGIAPNQPEPLRLFNADTRATEMAKAWKMTEQYASGELNAQHFLKNVKDDHATDIIESMWGHLGKSFYINTANRGAITNLSDDAYLELRCHLDLEHGPCPQPFGEFPRGALALQHQYLDTHELTAEAAVTGDRTILRRAMLTDPICNNIGDADNCIDELLEAEREALPDYWY